MARNAAPTRKLRRRGLEPIDTKAAKKKIATGTHPRTQRTAACMHSEGCRKRGA
jgi:hypothetical protein